MSQEPPPESFGQALPSRIGKYEIVKLLGKGALGLVFLAIDPLSGRYVALKVVSPADPDGRARVEREAKVLARLNHPNIVTFLDLGQHADGSVYIVLELFRGTDLQTEMREHPIPLDKMIGIVIQVLAALGHSHAAGIVHRDIKPANIFITQDEIVKLMDFGVARVAGSMNGTGTIVGTADYMSPEQVKGLRVDGRSDLFSVGCMLFEMLARKRPFHSDNLMAIFYKITHEEPNFDLIPESEPISTLLPILKKALQKDTDKRYQTAYDFALDLAPIYGALASAAYGKSEWILRLAHVAK